MNTQQIVDWCLGIHWDKDLIDNNISISIAKWIVLLLWEIKSPLSVHVSWSHWVLILSEQIANNITFCLEWSNLQLYVPDQSVFNFKKAWNAISWKYFNKKSIKESAMMLELADNAWKRKKMQQDDRLSSLLSLVSDSTTAQKIAIIDVLYPHEEYKIFSTNNTYVAGLPQ